MEKFKGMLGWIRNIGIATGLLGGIVLTQAPELFYYSVAFVYLGIGLVMLDLVFEPVFLHLKVYWRVLIILLFVAVLVGFSSGVVFVNSPLEVSAFMTDGEYPAGTIIAGISWRPQWTEVQVIIKNPSNRPYEDLDILVRPSNAIAAIGQLTSLGEVSFEDKNGMESRIIDVDLSDKKNIVPLPLLATDSGYRVRCPHLPARTSINVVAALADIKWNPQPYLAQLPIEKKVVAPNYILRIKLDDFSTYWKGHPDGDVWAPRPTSTDFIKIEGSYVGAQRPRLFSEKIGVGGKLTISH